MKALVLFEDGIHTGIQSKIVENFEGEGQSAAPAAYGWPDNNGVEIVAVVFGDLENVKVINGDEEVMHEGDTFDV